MLLHERIEHFFDAFSYQYSRQGAERLVALIRVSWPT